MSQIMVSKDSLHCSIQIKSQEISRLFMMQARMSKVNSLSTSQARISAQHCRRLYHEALAPPKRQQLPILLQKRVYMHQRGISLIKICFHDKTFTLNCGYCRIFPRLYRSHPVYSEDAFQSKYFSNVMILMPVIVLMICCDSLLYLTISYIISIINDISFFHY